MIIMGFNQGMQPIAGYNFGARQYSRVTEVTKLTMKWAIGVATTHHLETDNRKDRKDDMQTVHRRLDQLRIGRKHADDHRRKQLTVWRSAHTGS